MPMLLSYTPQARAYAEAAVNAAYSKQSKKVEEAEATLATTDAEIVKVHTRGSLETCGAFQRPAAAFQE
jgi:hypothetical protein